MDMHHCDEIGSDGGHCSHGCAHDQGPDGSCRRTEGSCHAAGECDCADDDICDERMEEAS